MKETWVIKIGSSLVTKSGSGLDVKNIRSWAAQIDEIISNNINVIIVSSGAIAEGMNRLGLAKRPSSSSQLQALAAIGQMGLVKAYEVAFKKFNILTAQMLLTHEDLGSRKRYLNARNTLSNLIKYKTIPIINENDTISTDEIKFGDNDILAAQIARLVKADHLILLSNVDGLYKEPPINNKEGVLISEVKSITNDIHAMAGTASKLGKGGMISKIKAAEICMKSNCSVIITSGQKQNPIMSLSKISTKATRFSARK